MVQSNTVQSDGGPTPVKRTPVPCFGVTTVRTAAGYGVALHPVAERLIEAAWPPGVPPFQMTLKRGQLVTAVRDLGPRVLKGARFVVDYVGGSSIRVIEASAYRGEGCDIDQYPDGESTPVHAYPHLPFEWPIPGTELHGRRVQFPVMPAFALVATTQAGLVPDQAALDVVTPPVVCDLHFQPVGNLSLRGGLKLVAHPGESFGWVRGFKVCSVDVVEGTA